MFVAVIAIILTNISGVFCAPLISNSHAVQDVGLAFTTVISLVVLVALVIVVVLCADGSSTVVAGAGIDLGHPPMWTRMLCHDPEISRYGFDRVSDGMRFITPNIVVRHRTGNFDTDGAQWGFPMTSGKHAFEVTWLSGMRGTHGTIGVGVDTAPMHSKRAVSLVGMNQQSWGVDIVRRRAVYKNVMLDKYPRVPGRRDMANIPNTFYVFVDMDAGILSMGCHGEYWGAAHSTLKNADQPLYLMVGCMKANAQIQVRYLGSEDKTIHLPPQVAGGHYLVIADGPQYTVPHPGLTQPAVATFVDPGQSYPPQSGKKAEPAPPYSAS